MRSRRRRGRRRRRPGRTRRGSGRRGRRMRPRRRSVYPRPAVVRSRRRRSGEGLRASREHRRGCENSGYLSYSSPKWARHKLSPRLFSIRYFYLNGLFIQRLCVSTVFPVPACAEASSAWGPVRASVPVCVSQVPAFLGPASVRAYVFRVPACLASVRAGVFRVPVCLASVRAGVFPGRVCRASDRAGVFRVPVCLASAPACVFRVRASARVSARADVSRASAPAPASGRA